MNSSHWIVRERFLWFIWLTLWLFVNPLSAIAAVADEYFLTAWSPKDGLPHEVVLGITQTPDGYLWVATTAGLARFDGARFKIAPFQNGPQNEPHAADEKVKAIQSDANGALWIVTDSGAVWIGKAGRFAVLSAERGSPSA